MFFKKAERKKLPAVLGMAVGALAVVGIMSIKSKGSDMMSCMKSKMKGMFNKQKGSDSSAVCECEQMSS